MVPPLVFGPTTALSALALLAAPSQPDGASAATVEEAPTPKTRPARRSARRLMLGLEGVVIQAPPLRPTAVYFDPRFLGRSVSMGGLGLVARYRLLPRISLEATVRSGSVRYAGRDTESDDVVSHDQVMGDAGVLLFVAQGDVARLAFDAGVGGIGTRIRYELDSDGAQTFGSALFRVGADAEFLVKRIAFIVSFRAYGVLTDRSAVRSSGDLFAERSFDAPVAARQTFLVGSAGVAYRF